IVIGRASSTVVATGGSFIYDGTTHAGGSAVVTGAGTVTGSAVLSYSGDRVDAGTYTVTATYDGDANHTGSSDSATIVIGKANATVVVTPYTATYDGSPHTAAVTSISGVNGEAGSAVGAVSLNTTHTNAGTYADSWSFTGAANYNDIAGAPITDVVNKAA